MGIPELNRQFLSSHLTFTMLKFFVSACLVAIASADITCDDCKKFETAMNAYLMSEASLAEQTELLAALLCPNTDDAAKCDEYVRGYWKEIANAVYPKFLDPTDVCTRLGACPREPSWEHPPVMSAWDPLLESLRSSALLNRSVKSSPSFSLNGALALMTPLSAPEPLANSSPPPCRSSERC